MLHTQEKCPLLPASYLQSLQIVPRAYRATDRALQNGFENNASVSVQLYLFTLLREIACFREHLCGQNIFSTESLEIKWVTITEEDSLHVLFTSTFCERLLLHTPSSSEDGHP